MYKRIRLVVFLIYFMAFLGIALPYPIMTPLFLSGQMVSPFSPEVALGIALAVYPLGLFFGGGFLGSYSDKYGRRPVLLVSLVITAVGTVWSGWAIFQNDFWQMVISRLVTGFFEANSSIARAMLVDVEKGRSKASSFALLSVGGYGGYLFGPVLGGYLSVWGNAVPFLVAGVMGAAAFVLAVLWLPETNRIVRKGGQAIIRPSVVKMFRTHAMFRRLIITQFFLTVAINTFYQFYPLMLAEQFGADAVMIAQINMFFTGSMIMFAIFGVKPLEQVWPLGRKLMFGGTAHGVLMLVIMLAATPLVGIFIAMFIGFSVAIMNAAMPAFLSRETPDLQQGAVMGAMTSSFCLAQAFISLVGGWVASDSVVDIFTNEGLNLQNWQLTFIIGSMAAFIGVLMVWRIRRRFSIRHHAKAGV